MEPGHEDREYKSDRVPTIRAGGAPQRSPVMKTGNTHSSEDIPRVQRHASMEPGHEDREYKSDRVPTIRAGGAPQWSPVMKTGNTSPTGSRPFVPAARLNGARS